MRDMDESDLKEKKATSKIQKKEANDKKGRGKGARNTSISK